MKKKHFNTIVIIFITIATYVFIVDSSLSDPLPYMSNCTLTALTGGIIESSPVMGDIDNDGDNEIIISSNDGYLYAWHHNGTSVENFPVYCDTVTSSPALGDIDNDGGLEIIIGGRNNQIFAFNGDGSLESGWPVTPELPPGRDNHFYGSPALADLDGDSFPEIIILGSQGDLFVYRHDGTIFDGWPRYLMFPYEATSTPAIGDIDNDGDLEIAVSILTGAGPYGSHFFCYHHDGTPVEGWPKRSYWGSISSPALGDLDGDGDMELVFVTVNPAHELDSSSVCCYHHNGEIVEGWPKDVLLNNVASSPAIADIDRDGDNEIIVGSGPCFGGLGTGAVYAWHHDGTLVSGWPVSQGSGISFPSSPITGDIDGDGDIEILIGSTDPFLYAFHHNGTLVEGWPLPTGEYVGYFYSVYFDLPIFSTPALGDLDGDGHLEVAIGSRDGRLYVWDLLGLSYMPQNVEWFMFHGNPTHTGSRINTPPSIGMVNNRTVAERSFLQFNVFATDIDGDVLNLTAYNLPLRANFEVISSAPGSITGTFSWRPNSGQTGTYNIQFYAEDPHNGNDNKLMEIEVVRQYTPFDKTYDIKICRIPGRRRIIPDPDPVRKYKESYFQHNPKGKRK